MAMTEYSDRAIRVTRSWGGPGRGTIIDNVSELRREQLLRMGFAEPAQAQARGRRRRKGEED